MLSPTFLLKVTFFAACAFLAQNSKAEEAPYTAPLTNKSTSSFTDGFSSKIQLRHYTDQKANGHEVEAISASQQVRASFKVKLLDEKLAASIEFGATKYDNQVGQLTLRRPYSFIDYKLYEDSLLSVRPFASTYLPHKDASGKSFGVDSTLGLASDVGGKIAVAGGSLKLNSAQEIGVEVSDKARDKHIKNETGRTAENLGWSEAEETEEGFVLKESTRDPIYLTRYLATAGYTPVALKDFSAELGVGLNHRVAPEYRVYNRGTTPGRYETSYQTETETYNRLKLSYKLTDAMNVSNETYQNFDGVYAKARNSNDRGNQDRGHRLSNIVKVDYNF